MAAPGSQEPSAADQALMATRGADVDISLSLDQLSLGPDTSNGTPKPARMPSRAASAKPALSRSSSSLSFSDRSKAARDTPVKQSNGRDTTSPTLLKKASMNSLHSVGGRTPSRRVSAVQPQSPTSRRLSRGTSPPERIVERVVPTAQSVAKVHFGKELEVLHSDQATVSADTAVILHDACYGHRFSRPRTSKSALSTIVERPERIRASVLGVAAAYVRLGERHEDGENAPSPDSDPARISSVPFRIVKTARRMSLLSPAVTNVHGTKWMEELKLMCDTAEMKLATNGKELQRPETNRGPDTKEPSKFHEGDLYLCAESLDAFEGALGAVCEAVDTVFSPEKPKRAFVAVRPPGHHCSASYPSGFCWINNVHVGIMHGILAHGLTHAAIIDFDLHHGDGSQVIAWQHNSRSVGLAKNAAWWKKTSIGYFSLHDINSYPCEMGDEEKVKNASLCIDSAHGQTVWNVHLEGWKTEADFWKLYETKYTVLLDKARSFLREHTARLRASTQNSKAAIFFSAGFDASEWEGAGMQRHSVNVPTGFYARIARDVVKIAEEEGTSVDGRVISVLEGGYSDRALTSGVFSHICGLAGTAPGETTHIGIKSEAAQNSPRSKDVTKAKTPTYNPGWWALDELLKLETDTPGPVAPKARQVSSSAYYSPTQASQAKMNPAALARRRESSNSIAEPFLRAPTPPTPELPWPVAATGLCSLLIPSTRTTMSCRHEELSAEATRARRDKLNLPIATPAEESPAAAAGTLPIRMSLRDRKMAAKPNYVDEPLKADKNRRRTVAGTAISELGQGEPSSSPSTSNTQSRPRQPSRRLSASSALPSDTVTHDPTVADPITPPLENTTGGVVSSNPSRASSSRSGSVMPETPLVAKQARIALPSGPTTTKTTAAAATGSLPAPKAPRARKPPIGTPRPRGRPPSPTKKASKPGPKPANAAGSGSSSVGPAAGMGAVDELTSGFRKIRLNVIPRAERERIAAEKERAETKISATTSSSSSTLTASKSLLSGPAGHPLTVKEDASVPDTSMIEHHPSQHLSAYTPYSNPSQPSQSQSPIPIGTPQSSSPPITNTATLLTRLPNSPGVFIPFQPEGPEPQAISRLENDPPLNWLPPNAATPSPMKRAELPVFTATSAIPFAMGGSSSRVSIKKEEGEEEEAR